jgi:ring-1,2-phenylacetyl-CoA epoxidase subunit PaaC
MNATLTFRNVHDLDPKLAASLLSWGMALADSKYFLGRRLSEWVNGAPTLEAAVGAAAMTQDELGHARSLYAMVREFPDAPNELGTENDLQRAAYFAPAALMQPWDSWTDVVAVNVLFDRALSLVFAAASESSFGPLKQRAAKVLQEEHFHRIFGDTWLARLADSDEKTKNKLRGGLEKAWSLAEAWIGPGDDSVTNPLVEANVLTVSPKRLRLDWTESGGSLLAKLDLNIEPPQIGWSRWDPRRREVVIDA